MTGIVLTRELTNLNIKELKQWWIKELKWISDSPFLDVSLIVQYVLKVNDIFIITHDLDEIWSQNVQEIKKLIQKRQNNIPIAYILNNKTFYGRDFFVNENVLIPRPETEELVEYAIKLQKENNYKSILDLWTGSGCIAITIKKELENINIFAGDISKEALKVAKNNAVKNNAKINFFETNLMSSFKNQNFDLIIANLPYVENTYNHNSIIHEPDLALFSGKNWLDHYIELSKQVSKKNCKRLLLEIADFQIEELKNIYKLASNITFIKDINWKNRIADILFN